MKKGVLFSYLVLLLLPLSLVACSGGGGGDEVSSAGISYTGLTAMVTIDENNAEEILLGTYEGGQTANGLNVLGVIQEEGSTPVRVSRSLEVSETLKDALCKMDFTVESGGALVGAIVTESDIVYGDYGGSASVAVNVDDQTGQFTGSMTFNNYTDDGIVTFSGPASFSGTIDLNTSELVEFTFSFDGLTGSSGGDSITFVGDISFDIHPYRVTMEMNMLLKDNSTGQVVKYEDYIVTVTDNDSDISVEISGLYFDPNYGYVSIRTIRPLLVYGSYLSDGVIEITGNSGIAGGSTKAQLTAFETYYQVEADTDGDGSYDWLTTGTWN